MPLSTNTGQTQFQSSPDKLDSAESPCIIFYNVGRTRCAQATGATRSTVDAAPTFLDAFIESLKKVQIQHYIVYAAVYSPAAAHIVVNTQDEEWPKHVGAATDAGFDIIPSFPARPQPSHTSHVTCFHVENGEYNSFPNFTEMLEKVKIQNHVVRSAAHAIDIGYIYIDTEDRGA